MNILTAKEKRISFAAVTVLVTVELLLALAVCGKYPFGEISLSLADLNYQYPDFMINLCQGSLLEKLYSFSKGYGGDMLGLIAYYELSPITWLTAPLLTKNSELAMLLMTLLHLIFVGNMACVYFNSHFDNWKLNVVASMLYVSTPFFFRFYFCELWLDGFALLPLLVLGCERLLERDRCGLFVGSYIASLFSNYYIAYISSLFILCYFFYYALVVCRLSAADLKKRILKIAGCVLLCLLLTAPVTLPAVMGAMETKSEVDALYGVGSGPIFNFRLLMLSFFDRTMMFDTFPQIAGSVLELCLLIVWLFDRRVPGRERLGAAVMLVLFLCSMLVRPLYLVWHGFYLPNGLWFRFIFCYGFFISILCRKSLEAFGGKMTRGLAVLAAAYALAFFFYFHYDYLPWEKHVLSLTAAALVCFFTLALAAGKFKGNRVRTILAVLLLAETVMQAGYFMYGQLKIELQFSSYSSGEFDENRDRVQDALAHIDDDSFYRLEDLNARRFNQPLGQGYYGINHFSSTFDAEQLEMNSFFGSRTDYYRMIYDRTDLLNDSVRGLKYILSDGEAPEGCELLYDGSKKVYYNPYYLPILFTGSTNDTPAAADAHQLEDGMFRTLCDIPVLDADGNVNKEQLAAASALLRQTACTVEKQDGGYLKCTAEGDWLLSTVPYDENWLIRVNGERVRPQRFLRYFLSVPLETGENTVEMFYLPQGLAVGCGLFLTGLVGLFVCRVIRKQRAKNAPQREKAAITAE